MAQTYLMLLWHQHQPFYKDLVEDRYAMPWVRLHALKDYFGMVAELRSFPSVHVTFNLVPSLVTQLEDYARDAVQEQAFDLAFKPAASLSLAERKRLMHYAFQVNRENLLSRYPRFCELYEKVRPAELGSSMAGALTEQEILDLQVVSQLAWFDEIYLSRDAGIRSLVARQRYFTETDKTFLRTTEITLMQAVLEEHRVAQERGQIEISTSPFYHPILPLLCNTQVAAESHPGVALPRRAFRRPEDARAQLRAAREQHRRVFKREPQGLWPSEGSVSDEVLRIAASEGFRWAASDEGVLGRSLGVNFARHSDGTAAAANELYRPHRFSSEGKSISLFFRDHGISDLIGFVCSRMAPEPAAIMLLDRIRSAGRRLGGRPAVVSVILDGENAWEFYRENGRPFLRTFYGLLERDAEIRAVTASEAVDLVEPGTLSHVVPGSWINANFDVWIGPEEDNRAWDLLADARDLYAEHSTRPDLDAESLRRAEQELWVAEGSDWNWWYGPEHSTANDEEFDWLYRKHLSNLYRLLGASPPDELAVPLKRPRGEALNVPPSGLIRARIDGLVTNYFEWLGAGVYSPATLSGSMHAAEPAVDGLYYGYSDSAFYLRLDLNRVFIQAHPEFEIRITLEGRSRLRAHAHILRGELRSIERWKDDAGFAGESSDGKLELAHGRVFELGADHALLGTSPGSTMRLQVSLWANEIPLQVIPQEGWLTIKIDEELTGW
jgi:alpha-amylase/alpha-mannosidase (GH57 family)